MFYLISPQIFTEAKNAEFHFESSGMLRQKSHKILENLNIL